MAETTTVREQVSQPAATTPAVPTVPTPAVPRRARPVGRRLGKTRLAGRMKGHYRLPTTQRLMEILVRSQSGTVIEVRESRTIRLTVRRPEPSGSDTIVPPGSRESSGIDRRMTTLELANEVLSDPGGWLKSPNDGLGDRAPIDLIGTDEERKVHALLSAVRWGLY